MTAGGFGYAAAVLLAGVFAVAAFAKVRDPRATADSFATLGLPGAAPMARIVPAVEAIVAVALVAWPAVGAPAALTTMVFFTTFLVTRLRAGVDAPCSCFGSARRTPLSGANLVGNGFLILLALAALAATGPERPSLTDGLVLASAVGVEVVVHRAVRHLLAQRHQGSAGRPAT